MIREGVWWCNQCSELYFFLAGNVSGVNILPFDLITGTFKQARKLRRSIFTLREVTQFTVSINFFLNIKASGNAPEMWTVSPRFPASQSIW
jgi:hypothetical protein